jgi:hypothetical protein
MGFRMRLGYTMAPAKLGKTLEVDISWVEQVESLEVHLLCDSPSRRVVIKASE